MSVGARQRTVNATKAMVLAGPGNADFPLTGEIYRSMAPIVDTLIVEHIFADPWPVFLVSRSPANIAGTRPFPLAREP